MRSLVASLGEHPMAMLRGIAELRGVALTSNVREEVVQQLAVTLAEPGATETALSALSPGAQAAWAELVAVGGRMKVPAFARRYGAIRPVGPGKMEREAVWRYPANASEELWYWGLIFRAFGDVGSGLLEHFHIPEDLGVFSVATQCPDNDAMLCSVQPSPPPVKSSKAHNSFAVDICTMLAALGHAQLRVRSSGQWRSADEAPVRERLLLTSPVRFALLITLAQEQGWLAIERGKMQVQAPHAATWLRTSAWEQTTSLFKAWESSTGWNDLRHVPSLRAEGAWRNDPLLARRAVLENLAQLNPGVWYQVADVVTSIKAKDPDFQRPDGNYNDWYLRDVNSDRYLLGFESWEEVEGRLITFLLNGPLFWLGAVALGTTASGQAGSFCLTAAGANWIDVGAPPEILPPAQLIVNDNFEVTAPLLVPLSDRFRLLRFTEPVDGSSELGEPTQHRINRHSLSNARAHGLSGEKILQFLRRATGDHVPSRVVAALGRWDQHGGAVRISKGAVLRVGDASTLAALRADPVVAPLLEELLSAQSVLVKDANLPRLLSVLAELGYSVKVE
jgi:hypothetical protein